MNRATETAATVTQRRAPDSEGTGEADTTELLREIGAMSRALRRPELLAAVRGGVPEPKSVASTSP